MSRYTSIEALLATRALFSESEIIPSIAIFGGIYYFTGFRKQRWLVLTTVLTQCDRTLKAESKPRLSSQQEPNSNFSVVSVGKSGNWPINAEMKMAPVLPEAQTWSSSRYKPFPHIEDIRVFVLCPCASRLAQGAVVRRRVQTPLQASPRLVPTYQGRQPGHRLHRGNAHTDTARPPSLSNTNISTRVAPLITPS